MKIYFHKATRLLQDPNNILVRFNYYNGVIRSIYGEEKGDVSQNIVDKLINYNNMLYIGKGKELLSHERYYRLPTH